MIILQFTDCFVVKETIDDQNHVRLDLAFGKADYRVNGQLVHQDPVGKPVGELTLFELGDMLSRLKTWKSISREVGGVKT